MGADGVGDTVDEHGAGKGRSGPLRGGGARDRTVVGGAEARIPAGRGCRSRRRCHLGQRAYASLS